MKSKKILIVIPYLSVGGTEIQTFNLARCLINNGYEVHVACLYRHISSTEKLFKDIGAQIFLFSPKYNRFGIKIEKQNPFALVCFLYKHFKQLLKLNNYDVIHVQYMSPALSVVLVLYYLLGQRNIIATSHTMADIYKTLKPIKYITKNCLRAFTCITQKAENSFFGTSQLYGENTILKRRNHFTIYNTLPQYIKIRNTEKIFDNDTLTIGVVSRLEKIKGMDLVIPAFAEVIKQGYKVKLLVVGDGSIKKEMEKQSVEFGVSNFIEWKGRTEQSKLQECYDKIDILLMPSRSEGFGLTAIEGMARGCAPVVSNTGGLSEVVLDNVSGLLHNTEDIKDLADKIVSLCENRKNLESLSKKAVERAKDFEFEKFGRLINDLYSKLVK